MNNISIIELQEEQLENINAAGARGVFEDLIKRTDMTVVFMHPKPPMLLPGVAGKKISR